MTLRWACYLLSGAALVHSHWAPVSGAAVAIAALGAAVAMDALERRASIALAQARSEAEAALKLGTQAKDIAERALAQSMSARSGRPSL